MSLFYNKVWVKRIGNKEAMKARVLRNSQIRSRPRKNKCFLDCLEIKMSKTEKVEEKEEELEEE